MSSMTTDEILSTAAGRDAVAEAGACWLAKKAAEFAGLPIGTVVIIDVETGDYVTAATHIEAMDDYERRIGADRLALVHEVGRRTFLGGGLGQG